MADAGEVKCSGRRTLYHDSAGFGFALEALQIGTHFGGVLIAQIAILLKSFLNDPFEFHGNFGIEADGSGRGLVQDRVNDVAGAFAAKGHRAGHHFVEHRSEGKQVGACVQFPAPHLLGRHVGDRAQHGARTGQVLFIHQVLGNGRGRAVGDPTAGHRNLGQSKVQNFGVTALVTKMFAGLMSR